MKKIKLTESDLIRLIEKVIKENEFSFADGEPNEIFEEYYDEIVETCNSMEIETMEDVDAYYENLEYLLNSIYKEEELNEDEKLELTDLLSDCYKVLEDYERELNDNEEDFGTMRGRFFDNEDGENEFGPDEK